MKRNIMKSNKKLKQLETKRYRRIIFVYIFFLARSVQRPYEAYPTPVLYIHFESALPGKSI